MIVIEQPFEENMRTLSLEEYAKREHVTTDNLLHTYDKGNICRTTYGFLLKKEQFGENFFIPIYEPNAWIEDDNFIIMQGHEEIIYFEPKTRKF